MEKVNLRQCEECKVVGGSHFNWCSQDPPNRIAKALETISTSLPLIADQLEHVNFKRIEQEAIRGDYRG